MKLLNSLSKKKDSKYTKYVYGMFRVLFNKVWFKMKIVCSIVFFK